MNTDTALSKALDYYAFIYYKLLTPAALSLAAVIGSNISVQAAQFNFSYAPGTPLEQMIGFEVAGGIWSDYLADDVTVNIYVEATNNLPENVAAGSLPGIEAELNYKDLRKKYLEGDITSADDRTAYDNMYDAEKKIRAVLRGANGKEKDGLRNEVKDLEKLNVSRANAKALGINKKDDSDLDGVILTNTDSNWNYDLLNTPDSSQLDFLSVAVHEIGHNLGFFSGIDNPGFLNTVSEVNSGKKKEIKGGDLKNFTVLDTFRRSEASGIERKPDLTIDAERKFFSIDWSNTPLADFAKGKETSLGGDGYQASHWSAGSAAGIMEATLYPGQRRSISTLDKQALDVIGWNLQPGGTDIASLQQQAKERLAQRIGVSVEWLEANPLDAAGLLTQDRFKDLDKMLNKSKIYDWGWGSGGGSSGWWQKGGLWQHIIWEEVDLPATVFQEVESVSVPEPASTIGLLGIGLLGISSLLMRYGKK